MKTFSIIRKMALMLFTVVCVGSAFSSDASAVSTRATSALTIDPSMGYIVTGLGELKDQVAVVFTNSAAAATWQAPKNLKDVEFLAVGGGGGGGGHYYNATTKNCQGGAGGGGGAVVTGFINELTADQVVNITVGAGGAGGAATTSATTGAGKGYNGGDSIIKVDDLTYITAYGGGGDGGYNSTGVAKGGSNSGARGAKKAVALKAVTVVGSGVESLVTDVVSRVNKGGSGYSTTSGYPGPGGGGAGSVGGTTYSSDVGGSCGYGYVSTITGSRVVYGAGGGGGNGKNSGYGTEISDEDRPFVEGAGLGIVGQAGSDALSNQGGGGGGGSWKKKGGNGGSGVVILRFGYSEVDIPVDVAVNITPKISDKVYTGEALVSGLVNTYAYTVEELGERINVGQQTVRVTLNDGYYWTDGDTNRSKEITWNINQEPNNWKVEPYLSHTTWPQIFAFNPNFKFRAPEASFGILQSELSTNGASPQPFSGILPTEPGSYTLRYWVNSTANWAAKEWKVNFTIYRSEDFAGGYKVYGLGEKGDEIAVVFTNSASWTVPAHLKRAQFLVVGGGGGGGADVYDDAASGGAGGGGGGVVTGEVDLTNGSKVAITVGAGGAGGVLETNERDGLKTGNYYGASKKGGNSILKVGGTTYVTAYGGGRDRGSTKRYQAAQNMAASDSYAGGQGGSNAGSRGGITTDQLDAPQKGTVESIAALRNYTIYGNKGGKGCSDSFYGFPAAGGGGGATEPGGDAGNNAQGWPGGKGGEGLASDITGARVVYGSGGGGASTQGDSGGKGGEGAGDGGDREGSQGTSALANQGGGGGGSSRETQNGGKGGSGIVVIRYRCIIDVDAIKETLADRIYTGELQTIENGSTYTVSGTVSATNAGEYHITITPQDEYHWPDTITNEPRDFIWRILQASNEWISNVFINTNSWTLNVDVAGVITPPKAQVGEAKAMISKDGALEKEFDGNTSKIFEPGVYVVTYYPPESTANFTSENMSPQDVIFEVFINDIIPEYSIHISEPERIGSDRKAVIPYEVTCEVASDKMLNLYACYTILGEGLTKTNLVSAIKGIKGIGKYEITDLKPGAEYQISFYGDIEGTIQSVEPIITTVVPSAATDLKASSVFVNNPMEFRISGSVIPGLGTTVVKVYWALNDASQLEVNAPKQFVYSIGDIGVELGKPVEFAVAIPYTSLSDKLIWKVEVKNSLVTDTWGEQTFDGPVTEQEEKKLRDGGNITYSWIGKGTPDENGVYRWTDVRNWSPSVKENCIGYPGVVANDGWDRSTICFTPAGENQVVDLGGVTYSVKDGGEGYSFEKGARLTLKNGTIKLHSGDRIGAEGSKVEFNEVRLPSEALTFAANSTNIFSGNFDLGWYFNPASGQNSKLILRDGLLITKSVQNKAPGTGTEVEINNAVWQFSREKKDTAVNLANGIASVVKFRDGPDRQAQITIVDKIKLYGTYDFKLPTIPHSEPYMSASLLSATNTCTMRIDVSNYSRGRTKVPLMLFTGELDNNTKNAMKSMTNDTSKLVVKANGVDVREMFKAKLEWDESKKTLYYSQSPSAGTRIIVR